MKTIRSISPAFSQQPWANTISVGDNLGAWDDLRIVKRMESVPMTPDVSIIEGYDESDKILFAYIATAVNVHYF